MLVFISWSGETSRYVAEQLRTWLKDVLQQIEPWVSSEDVRQGARWNVDIAKRLEGAAFGILCLTRDNFNQPWLVFEAGALAKTLDNSHVCPYLIDLKPTELQGPLVQFQAASATEGDTRKLLHSINKALGSNALPDAQVDRACARWWPDLERALSRAPAPKSTVIESRSDRELIEELLNRVRRMGTKLDDSNDEVEKSSSMFTFPLNLFQGADVTRLMVKCESLGLDDDPNSILWSDHHLTHVANQFDGIWSTRWGGGMAPSTWVSGIASVQMFDDALYALTHDGRADCLIAVKRINGNVLAGRYINLGVPTEVLPWAGVIVNPNRIDGYWTQGRWDLRRGHE